MEGEMEDQKQELEQEEGEEEEGIQIPEEEL